MVWLIVIGIIILLIILKYHPLIEINIDWNTSKKASEENDCDGKEQTKLWYLSNKGTILYGRFILGEKHRITYRPKLE
ncbi:hypothetical protein RMB13_20630 [Acinetobacter sp. V102_4]|uniref:hypothetical protein n=1 Tax=Acinetobacter sp. V102_4 TaxID=3072984 RepID=UPI00287C29D5|nr:hypothetical protein [Acinetobacter sp. V102_4]MDS7931845.1 hypothetical protein [Acinetobacter sp. V102_4]